MGRVSRYRQRVYAEFEAAFAEATAVATRMVFGFAVAHVLFRHANLFRGRFGPASAPSDAGPEGDFYVYALKRIHGGTERLATIERRVPAAGPPSNQQHVRARPTRSPAHEGDQRHGIDTAQRRKRRGDRRAPPGRKRR